MDCQELASIIGEFSTSLIFEGIRDFIIVQFKKPVYNNTLKLSKQAQETLERSIINVKNYKPIKIQADGNCLFRALSKCAYGKEDFHVEIRMRTGIKMVTMKRQLLDYIQKDKFRRFYPVKSEFDTNVSLDT
jgi:hypothetical protein